MLTLSRILPQHRRDSWHQCAAIEKIALSALHGCARILQYLQCWCAGASGGSGEATVTIQHSRVATPATGRTDNSASSTSSITSAQAEAETLNLCQRGPPGLALEPARPHAGLHEEPTSW